MSREESESIPADERLVDAETIKDEQQDEDDIESNETSDHDISLEDIAQEDIKEKLDKLFSALQTSGWAKIGQLNLDDADSIMAFIALNINNQSKHLQDIAKSLVRLAFELPYMQQPNATYPFFKRLAAMGECTAVQPLLEYMTAVVCQLYDVAKKFDGKKRSDETKPTSLLLRAMADVCPHLIYPYLTRFLRFLNHEQPAIRVSTLYAINAVLRCQDMSAERIKHFPRKRKTKDDLIDRVRDAMQDDSSLVRVAALKMLSDLTKDNLITKAHFRMGLIGEIGEHLREDKISVRRAAAHWLSTFLEVNAYGHDFDYELHKCELVETLEQKTKLLAKNPENKMVAAAVEQFDTVESTVKEHILYYVKKFRTKKPPAVEGDPASVYGAVINQLLESTKPCISVFVRLAFDGNFQFLDMSPEKSDTDLAAELLAVLKEEYVNVKTAEFMANQANVLNNEQDVEDYENKLKQLNKKIVAIRDILVVGLELEHCLPAALTCIFNGETSEVKELIKFIAECKQFNIKGADSAVRSMCSLIWKNNEEVRQAVLDSAVLMFCSSNQQEDIRDEATTNNLIGVMCDISHAERGCVEEVIRRISTDHIGEGVVNRLWAMVRNKQNAIPLSQKIAAMRLISVRVMSNADRQRMRGRLRSFQQIIKESHPMIAVEALKGIANLAEEYDNSTLESIQRPVLRIPMSDSIFSTIEKFFFREIMRESMLEKTGKHGMDYWFHVVQNTLDIIFNVAKDTNLLLARFTARLLYYLKQVSEAYFFYWEELNTIEMQLDHGIETSEAELGFELIVERKLHWARVWIRLTERVLAFAGEVATRSVVHVGHSFHRSARALVSLLSNTFNGKIRTRTVEYSNDHDEVDELEYAAAKGQFFLGYQKSKEDGVGGMGDEERLNERAKCIDQRLLEDNALLGRLFQLVMYGLRADEMPRVIRNAAAVAFGKFMLISPILSTQGTYLFTALMTAYPVEIVRHNLLVNCVDFYSRQSNSISQYKHDLYSVSKDSEDKVRYTYMLVITQLTTTDMIKPSGTLFAFVARGLIDVNPTIVSLAKNYFNELIRKPGVLYNAMLSLVTRLSRNALETPLDRFKIIIDFVCSKFSENKVSTDLLVDKLCEKLQVCKSDVYLAKNRSMPAYFSYAIARLGISTDTGFAKVIDKLSIYSRYLEDRRVYDDFSELITRYKNKVASTDEKKTEAENFLSRLQEIHAKGLQANDLVTATPTAKGKRGRKAVGRADLASTPSSSSEIGLKASSSTHSCRRTPSASRSTRPTPSKGSTNKRRRIAFEPDDDEISDLDPIEEENE